MQFCSPLACSLHVRRTRPTGPHPSPERWAIPANRSKRADTDSSPSKARDRALLRAAELTLLEGSDWFEITSSFAERSEDSRSGGSSVSIGGSSGSRGHSSVGVGVGIGIPLGGGNSGSVTEVLEIVTGKGDKPDLPSVYDARSVDINLRGSATE